MAAEHFALESFTTEFYKEYEKRRRRLYDPALDRLEKHLDALLNEACSTSRPRLRVEKGRIKEANRLLLKAQQDKYLGKINAPKDIFDCIRDIVGTRITCNTVKDAYSVLGTINSVAIDGDVGRPFQRIHENPEDDYIKQPKETGYRALSILVGIPVPVGSKYESVACEIQIRTLLQHAWGELTHEDTYKPEMKVPKLMVILSKRLAGC